MAASLNVQQVCSGWRQELADIWSLTDDTGLCRVESQAIVKVLSYLRHAICHGCTDIIRVKYLFCGVIFTLNNQCFAENSVLFTNLVAHRFTLGNPVLAIPIINLLRVI